LQIAVECVGKVILDQPIVDELAALVARYESCVFQHGKVLRHCWLGDVEPLGNLASGQFRITEIGENLAPCSGGEGFKHTLHGLHIRDCLNSIQSIQVK